MSIIITGLEMPEDGTFSIVHIYSDGHVSMPFWGKGMQIVGGITAVPVPKHGRLIDADAEIERVQKLYDKAVEKDPEMGCVNVYEGEIAVLQLAPTIIPAEEGET